MPSVTAYRSLSMKALRVRGVTDEQVRALGGVVQKHNVIFSAGESYDRAAELLKLPPMPRRPATTAEAKEWLRENGPRLWHDWHAGLLTIELTPDAIDAFTQKTIVDPLPRASCSCRSHIKLVLKHVKPKSITRRDVLDWSYFVHDAVSVKLMRPPFGLDRARAIYE